MHFLQLSFLYYILSALSSEPVLEYQYSSVTKNVQSVTAGQISSCNIKPGATNILFQSKDGGQTWEDISYSLPEDEQPEDFFAGDSELYLRIKNVMYHSKSKLKTPIWVKDNVLDPRATSIAFNHSGVMAFNYEGQIYQKTFSEDIWSPGYTNFKNHSMRTIFETSDGTLFIGCDNGLYKSADRGQRWKRIFNEGWIMDMVESEGVLVATSQKGIMRSTDHGEHWESVINEGGVGIAIERINGGFAAISYSTTATSRRIRISWDSGKTWTAIDEGLQPSLSISSIKQVGDYLICGHPDGIFRSSDMGKTWKIVQPSAEYGFKIFGNASNNGKVFKLYVSGNTVYAVAKNAGC